MFGANYPGISDSSPRLSVGRPFIGMTQKRSVRGLARKRICTNKPVPCNISGWAGEALRGSLRDPPRSVAHNDSIRRDPKPNGAAATASAGDDRDRRR